jgi:hypothetical protein
MRVTKKSALQLSRHHLAVGVLVLVLVLVFGVGIGIGAGCLCVFPSFKFLLFGPSEVPQSWPQTQLQELNHTTSAPSLTIDHRIIHQHGGGAEEAAWYCPSSMPPPSYH